MNYQKQSIFKVNPLNKIEELAKNKIDMFSSLRYPSGIVERQKYTSGNIFIRLSDASHLQNPKIPCRHGLHGYYRDPIYATGNGVVIESKFDKGYGRHVVIDHGFSYKTLYAHMDKILAKKGQKIKRGDVIGYLGNTGLSTGPHLHYEVRKNDKPIDPINFYFNDLTPDEFELLVETANNTGQSMD